MEKGDFQRKSHDITVLKWVFIYKRSQNQQQEEKNMQHI